MLDAQERLTLVGLLFFCQASVRSFMAVSMVANVEITRETKRPGL